VPARLPRGAGQHLGIPAAAELLHRRHVDRPVVEVLFDRREVHGEEPTVGADRVAAQRHRAHLGHVLPQEAERRRAGLLECRARRPHRRQQAALGVHVDDELLHRRQRLRGLVHGDVGTLGHDPELVVGDERGQLEDDVAQGIEPGHLEVHPHQHRPDPTLVAVLEVPIVRLDPELALPAYARPGDGGADLVARTGAVLAPGGGRAAVPTGIALALPDGWAGFVQPRSGLALTSGVTVLNAPGLVDAGYRDEVRVVLVNTDPAREHRVERGQRIAQLVVQQVARCTFTVVDELPASERGTGGFGHSGS
jgi:dUTP pyrophosphatase